MGEEEARREYERRVIENMTRQAFAQPVTATTAIANEYDFVTIVAETPPRDGRDIRANTTPTPFVSEPYTPIPIEVDYNTWRYKTRGVVITVNSTIDGNPSAQEMRVDQEMLEHIPNARQHLHETLDMILDNLFEGSTLIWKR